MTCRRRRIIVAALALRCLAAFPGRAAVPDGAVAVVNDEVITRREFGDALVRTLGRTTLDSFLDEVLVEREAERRGVSVTEDELDARRELEIRLRLMRLLEGRRLPFHELSRWAAEAGFSEADQRREVDRTISRRELKLTLLAERLMQPGITVSEDDVDDYVRRTRGACYVAEHIAVTAPEEARALVTLLQSEPEQWMEMALAGSMDRASLRYDGRMPPVPADSELGREMGAHEPGEVFVWRSPVAWHVVRMVRQVPAAAGSAESREVLRHEVYCRRAYDRLPVWLAALHAEANVVDNIRVASRAVLGEEVALFVDGRAVELDRFRETLIDRFAKGTVLSYVERVLILQQARKRGVTAPDEDVEDAVRERTDALLAQEAYEQGVRPAELREIRLAAGVDEDQYRAEMAQRFVDRDDVRALLLARRMAADPGPVSEEAVRLAYRERYGERLAVRRAILNSQEAAMALRSKARQGADFERLVLTESTEPMVWLSRGLVADVTPTHPYFRNVENLREGGVSRVFEDGKQYVVLQVLERHDPGEAAPPMESVRDELERHARAQRARRRVRAWIELAKAGARIEVAPEMWE